MPEPDPVEDLTRGRNKIAATIFVAHAIKHLYNSGQGSLIMPEIKLSLGLNRAQFGSLATSSAIAWWSSTMFAGYLGDRFSNRAGMMLAFAMSLMGGAFFLVGIAPGYRTMLLVMFLAGIGPSMFHPPALGELSRRFPDRRGFAVSLHGMGANIGEVLGAPAVAGLLTFMMWRDIMKTSLVENRLATARNGETQTFIFKGENFRPGMRILVDGYGYAELEWVDEHTARHTEHLLNVAGPYYVISVMNPNGLQSNEFPIPVIGPFNPGRLTSFEPTVR